MSRIATLALALSSALLVSACAGDTYDRYGYDDGYRYGYGPGYSAYDSQYQRDRDYYMRQYRGQPRPYYYGY